jgi:hypothetical protein
MGNKLECDLIKIIRHVAQNGSAPQYSSFEDRDLYDLDKLAQKLIELDLGAIALREYVGHEFDKPDLLWKTFYKSSNRLKAAVDGTINRLLAGEVHSEPTPQQTIEPFKRELTEQEKDQIKRRDGYTCLCCGAKGQGIRLQIDHILPVFLGGETTLDNSQTLCSICNRDKNINEINFRRNVTTLKQPKSAIDLSIAHHDSSVVVIITRIINFFYHCNAVCQVNLHERRNGKYYSVWEIQLYSGNNPEWLLNHPNKAALICFIQRELGFPQVEDIQIVT